MIDQIEAVRNASTRRGASSSGNNPPANPPSITRPTKKTPSKTRITKKTPANQTAYGGATNQNFPEPNQLNEDEKQAIRFARLAASKNRKMTDQQKQLVEHYKGKRIPAAKKNPKGWLFMFNVYL